MEQSATDSAPDPISGATKSSYKIPASRAGEVLTVRVTATKSGYTPASNTSVPAAAIAGQAPTP
jgi:hypothetical protein